MTEIEKLEKNIQDFAVEIAGLKHQIAAREVWIGETKKKVRDIKAAEEAAKMTKFWTDLGEEHGVLNNPKFDLLCEKAYQEGHSEGESGMRNAFIDLLDLIQ